MKILHTEASPGWGGQERRILHEALGMRARGHEIVFCVQTSGGLIKPARDQGFQVYELDFARRKILSSAKILLRILHQEHIQLVNTHSSADAWLAGILARFLKVPVIRTRHLSSAIRPGLNSLILYNWLADYVVTTCAEIVPKIQQQAHLPQQRCRSIPTGITPFKVCSEKIQAFRSQWGLQDTDCVVGTLCVLRGWKGVADLLQAAALLKDYPHLKWLIVGSGPSQDYFQNMMCELQLQDKVIFTGHLDHPFEALGAMDIFCLLSYAHEGVSQAALQAAWMKKPLITTPTGGLKEVCLPKHTGLLVPPCSPQEVAAAVTNLSQDILLRQSYGECAHQHVAQHFLTEAMLDKMEEIYAEVSHV